MIGIKYSTNFLYNAAKNPSGLGFCLLVNFYYIFNIINLYWFTQNFYDLSSALIIYAFLVLYFLSFDNSCISRTLSSALIIHVFLRFHFLLSPMQMKIFQVDTDDSLNFYRFCRELTLSFFTAWICVFSFLLWYIWLCVYQLNLLF